MILRVSHILATAASMALATALSGAALAQGVDRVHRHNGVDSGQITAVTALNVTVSKGGVESTVPAEDVASLYFAGEPPELNAARTALQAGRPQDALTALEKITAASIRRDEIRADVDFYAAQAEAQLAMAGQGDLAAATAAVRGFMSQRRSSIHVPQAIETLGDLLVAAGTYADARVEYAKLAKAPSKYFGLRSALLVGRSWQAEGKHDQALPEFEKVIDSPDGGALFDPLKLSATLDRAVSQSATGKGEDATATIGQIIVQADPEDGDLLARAYAALGDSYRAAGDNEGALFAFLHIDLLYNNSPDLHAKALHELVALWRDSGRENRSQDAAQKLAEKYPASRWAKP